MKFTIDFEITPELEEKFKEELEQQAYANFCVAYINQIRNKLDFSIGKIKTKKQEKNKETGILETKEVLVYRCTMDMVVIREKSEKEIVKKNKSKKIYGSESKEESYNIKEV